MKVSLNWLNEYINLKDIPLNDIIDKLTYAGLEVEDVVDQAKNFENMFVGFVKERKKHPNADKLSLCIVSDGDKEYNVVCGAANVEAGQKIAFAKIGTLIPSSGLKLEKVKIRGVVSEGMICSEKEIGLGEDHEGILVLDASLKEGVPLEQALKMNDAILEIAVTPNRADALSHIGIARDLSALFDKPLTMPEITLNESNRKSHEFADVEIIDSENCPRYIGKVVLNVEIKESPEWLKNRLKSIGLRPINNVVDVTNFVMHEIGQPLHAFDLDNLAGNKIVVRSAYDNEKFVTLDTKERTLNRSNMMICDAEKSVAIAGVMGGENSEVTSSTKNILIESAFFNPSSVRKTAKQLSVSSDASFRFERGTDPNITKWAAQRAAQLIQQTAGGVIAQGEIDAYQKPRTNKSCTLRFSRIEKILGYQIRKDDVEKILIRLGFIINNINDELSEVVIPTFRNDIEREIDIIEEIARIYSYNKIPEVAKISVTLEEKVDQSSFVDRLRIVLTSLGFFEILTNSLLNEETAKSFGQPIAMLNPQSSEMSHLRPSLLPGMLLTISKNLKVNEKDLQLFEIGKVFNQINKKIESFADFSEEEHLLLAITGNAQRSEWYEKDRQFDLYDLKGFVKAALVKIFPELQLKFFPFKQEKIFFEYGFDLFIEGEKIGSAGKLPEKIAERFDVTQDILIFIADIGKLKKISPLKKTFKELLKYPKVYRDCAFILDETVEVEAVIEIIKGSSSNLLHNIKLFDIFQSESLGKQKKSLAFQLEYYDSSKTLTEEEVEKDFWNSIKAVEKKLNAQLRGT